ncbi:helix-turn-helix domain-containing protein [Nocardioides sp. P5_C9_2]
MKPHDAPRLNEWLTASETAEQFNVSRQTVNQMIKAGEFSTLHKIGPATRPQYVIGRDEVEQMRATRAFPRRG